MNRYFIELAYLGTNYAGFQIQKNANTIQAELEKSFTIFFKQKIDLTGSSRTDAGVHAHQNFFHFDCEIDNHIFLDPKTIYHLNAILPPDIVVKKITQVANNAHCRFNATSRLYHYFVYQNKNPFLKDTGYYFPYPLQISLLQQAANIVLNNTNFTSFSKKNTQVNNFNCAIFHSLWKEENNCIIYEVAANRFLRGMVRGLVATMLQVGTGKITLDKFNEIILSNNCANANFNAPAHGLFLKEVKYT